MSDGIQTAQPVSSVLTPQTQVAVIAADSEPPASPPPATATAIGPSSVNGTAAAFGQNGQLGVQPAEQNIRSPLEFRSGPFDPPEQPQINVDAAIAQTPAGIAGIGLRSDSAATAGEPFTQASETVTQPVVAKPAVINPAVAETAAGFAAEPPAGEELPAKEIQQDDLKEALRRFEEALKEQTQILKEIKDKIPVVVGSAAAKPAGKADDGNPLAGYNI